MTCDEEMTRWNAVLMKEWTDSPDMEQLPEPFTYEWMMHSSLGFYLFATYIKETSHDYLQINFIEELLRWRYLRGQSRGSKLKRIYEQYLLPCPRDELTKQPIRPPLLTIEEVDLECTYVKPPISKEDLRQLALEHMDDSCRKSAIGIHGRCYDSLMNVLEDYLSRESSAETVEISLDGNTATEEGGEDGEGPTGNGDDQQDESDDRNDDDGDNESISSNHSTSAMSQSKLAGRALSRVPKEIFAEIEMIILECIRLRHFDDFKKSGEWPKFINYLWHRDKKISDEDFFLMRVLGRGGFGLVTACKKGTTGTLYAMKVMNKKRIKAKKSVQLALNERACLASVDSPFVVNLKYSFQTKDDLYLILDLMTGGDLSFHLSQRGRFPKEDCLYYASRIMLGLQALHDKNYVYRDLKPENLLLAEDGRVRITDLGLATQVTPTLHGAAGTRGYWAPEMLRRNEKGKRMNYDQRVDWFSYGCVVAEMICGCNPFRSENALKFGLSKASSKEKALDYATLHMEPSFESKKFTATSTDLCRKLLQKDPKERLGSNGCEEIMAHPWFKDLDWEMIISDRAKPPFEPLKDINAASQSEIGTFAEDRNALKLSDEDQDVYQDWDWTSQKVFCSEVIEMLIYERDTGKPLIPLTVAGSCCCAIS